MNIILEDVKIQFIYPHKNRFDLKYNILMKNEEND